MERETRPTTLWWCRTCGVVWASSDAPICRHFVIDGPPADRMELLPTWHPFAVPAVSDGAA